MVKASVIIPVFNGEKTIRPALEALLAQTYPHQEIIVVDDGSTDRTGEIVRGFNGVIYILQQNAGPATARNAGARQARGEIICFTDADCLAHPDWVERLVRAFGSEEIGAVAGSYGIANNENLLARCVHEEIVYRHEKFLKDFVRAFGSYNCAIKKKVFDGVGGFDERYRGASGEDNDLSYKILKSGQKIFFEKAALVDHYHPTQLENYLRSQFQHGFWRAKMYRDHPGMSTGDDYTFWKDMVEVVLVLGIMSALVVALAAPAFMIFLIGLLGVLLLLEFFFAVAILKKPSDAIYFAWVMFLRSFARSFAFAAGLLRFIFSK